MKQKTEHEAWLEWAEYVAAFKNKLINEFRSANYGKIHPDKIYGKSHAYADNIIHNDAKANELMHEWYKFQTTKKQQ